MTTENTPNSFGPATSGVTGRDGYIVIQALLYAIARIQSLPADRQEWANMRDMCELVRAGADARPQFWHIVWGVESHVDQEIDLWPDSEAMTDADRELRAHLRSRIRKAQARFEATGLALEAPPRAIRLLH